MRFQPDVGVGLTALRAMPVVAGMIPVVKARAVRTLKELSAQGRGTAGEDLAQDLPMPSRHRRAEAIQIIRCESPEQLMDREAFTAAGGGAHKLAMKLLSRI